MPESRSMRITARAWDILQKVNQKLGTPKTVAVERAVVRYWESTVAARREGKRAV